MIMFLEIPRDLMAYSFMKPWQVCVGVVPLCLRTGLGSVLGVAHVFIRSE